MVDRLYYRLKDLEQLWRNIKTRRKLLTYRDKYRDEQRKEGNTDEQASSAASKPRLSKHP